MFGRNKGDPPRVSTGPKQPQGGVPEAKPLPQPTAAPSLHLRKPLPAQPARGSASRIAEIPGMIPPRSEMRSYGVESKTLVVGREISLSGNIAACDKLVVEGCVEADLDHCRELDISPTGLFKGSAAIDEADIAGRFEGSLTVHKRLRVRSSGRVTGTLTYGQIEIEAGGEVSGEVRVVKPEPKAAPSKPVPTREGTAAEAGG
ncbi:MAG TPA: polymer-forming cytoskeletal protein [Alphaproteobacteria bacterium]|jgi:cytoskeletal protein CcmA (bactofilin family)